MAAVLLATSLLGTTPATAHGGDVVGSASASPSGPLTAVVTLNATWAEDGHVASGLSVSASASGPGSTGIITLGDLGGGTYRGTMSFSAGGTYGITVSWSGDFASPGGTSTSVTLEGNAPPPTQAPAPPSGGGSTGGGSTGGGSTGGGSTGGGGTTTPGATTAAGEPTDAEPAAEIPPALASAATEATGLPVILTPGRAPRGGYVFLRFAVPNPSATADVTAVSVTLPAGILGATVRSLPGWRGTVQRTPAADANSNPTVATITWAAGGGSGLRPGEFQEFVVQIGPLPKRGATAVLPVTVALSDGTAQTWGTDAPALRLTRAGRGNASAHG